MAAEAAACSSNRQRHARQGLEALKATGQKRRPGGQSRACRFESIRPRFR